MCYCTPSIRTPQCHKIDCVPKEKEHDHSFKKTLDKSGMFFIYLCHECMEIKPYHPDEFKDLFGSFSPAEEHHKGDDN